MRSLRTLEVVEGYFDGELTPELVTRLHDVPLAHFEGLADLLAGERAAWQDETSAEIMRGGCSVAEGSVLLLDSAVFEAKPLLLLAESLAVPDPLDPSAIQPTVGANEELVSWQEEDEDTQRSIWIQMLAKLAAIRPLLTGVEGLLLVSPGLRGTHLPASPEDFIEQWCGPDLHRSLKDRMMYLEERAGVERPGELLALARNMGYVPCTGNESTLDLLGWLNVPSVVRRRPPSSVSRALSAIAEYRLPELRTFDVDTLVALRRNDDAFRRFRSALTQVLAMTQLLVKSLPNEMLVATAAEEREAVVREFRAQIAAQLQPEVDRLESAIHRSVFSHHFLPTALPLTFGMAGVVYFSESLIGTLIGAGASLSVNVIADLLHRRSSRQDKVLRSAYLGLGVSRLTKP